MEILKKNNDRFDYKVEWGTDLQTEHVVGLQNAQPGFQAVPNVVHRQIGALVLHLGGQHDDLAAFHPAPDALKKAARLRQTAHAEALDNQGVVSLHGVR